MHVKNLLLSTFLLLSFNIAFAQPTPCVPVIQSSFYQGCASPVFYNNVTYFKDTSFVDTIKAVQGCDSIYHYITISVFSNGIVKDTLRLLGCNAVTYNNITYKQSTNYIDTFKTKGGCDSLFRWVFISVNNINPITITNNYSACGSISYKGVVYTNSTTVADTLKNNFGCDSVYHVVNLKVGHSSITPNTVTKTYTGCKTLVYYNGNFYSKNAIIRDTLKTIDGCDSVYNIVYIYVYLTRADQQTLVYKSCNKINYNGITYYNNTTLNDTLKSIGGCDSVYRTIYLLITHITPTTVQQSFSGCGSLVYKGVTYTNNTVLLDTLKSYQGCDSVYTITNLWIGNSAISPKTVYQNYTGCFYPVFYNGAIYRQSTIVNDTIRSIYGCDSIYNVTNITVYTKFPTAKTVAYSGCNQVIYKGILFKNSTTFQDTVRSIGGCDSLYLTVNILVNSITPIYRITNYSGCNSFNYNGTTYFTNTQFIDTVKSYQGCDSIYNVTNIIVRKISPITYSVTYSDCNSVRYKGITYTSSTVVWDTIRSVLGCDSIYTQAVILVKTITPTTRPIFLYGCNSVMYNGKIYTKSTQQQDTLRSVQGCDSLYTVANIVVYNQTTVTNTTTYAACYSVFFRGINYTKSTRIIDTITNIYGCDSVYNEANIVISNIVPMVRTTNLFGCNAYLYNGILFVSSASLKDTIRTSLGCDSVYITTNIFINKWNPITNNISLNGCNRVVYNGRTYNNTTLVKDTIKGVYGCDSIYNIATITVYTITPVVQTLTLQGCKVVTYKGINYTSSTIVKDTLKTINGCDSIYNIATIYIANITPTTKVVNYYGCNTFIYNGILFASSATYNDTIRTSLGCDSIYKVVNIYINPTNPITNSISLAGCNAVLYRNTLYRNSTIVRDTTRGLYGCDSIYTIATITVYPTNPTVKNLLLQGCKSVLYNGVTYTQSITVTDTLKTINGCDSIYRIATIKISNITPVVTQKSYTACNTFLYKGITYASSATIIDTIKTSLGCDSIYNQINIIINKIIPSITSTSLSGCGSVAYKGITYKSNTGIIDTIKSVLGCDSIYKNITITVYPSTPITRTFNLFSCTSLLYNGKTYTTSTTLRDTLKNQNGCDSIYTIANINIPVSSSITNIAYYKGCNSVVVKGVIYTNSIILRDTVKSILGCDSIYNIANITVNKLTPVTNTITLKGCGLVVNKNITYTSSTVLKDTVFSSTGCDSIYNTTNINVNSSYTTAKSNYYAACNSYTFKGINYTQSTLVKDTIKTVNGCDSIYNNNYITIWSSNPVTNQYTLNGCKSVAYKGITYFSSTIVRDTVKSIYGCDSIYNIATINVYGNISYTNNNYITACGSYTYKNIVYTNSIVVRDTVRTALGCDSIYNNAFITIVNIAPKTVFVTYNNCSAIIYKGITYTSPALVRDTLKSVAGCDSIYTVTTLNIFGVSPTTNIIPLTGCGSLIFRGILYVTNAVVKDTLRTSFGCDSVYNAYVITINPVPATPTITITSNNGSAPICGGTTVNFTASAKNTGTNAIYQWKKNGVNVGTGTALALNNLNDSDIITCVLQTTLTCIPNPNITSNAIIVRVNYLPYVNLTASNAGCLGTSVIYFTGASALSPIYWMLGNSIVKTTYPSADTIASTIAGNGVQGSAANQFNAPKYVYVDASKNIYIADQYNHRVQKWAYGATTGVTVAGGNGEGSAANQLDYPSGIWVDTAGAVYIADAANHRIQKWAKNAITGVTVAGGNGQGAGLNQLNNPSGIQLDTSGNMYIVDQLNSRVLKWTLGAASGSIVAGNGTAGSGNNQFQTPYGLYVDAAKNIYVADQLNHRIMKWAQGASTGTVVAGGNGFGTAANQLFLPTGVAVDASGNVYVADGYNNRIQKWAPSASTGTTVIGGRGIGTSNNQLNNPWSIFIDNASNLYIADNGNNRIQFVNGSGSIDTTFKPTIGGTYTATGYTTTGCLVTAATVIVSNNIVPSVAITSSITTPFCSGTPVTFTATPTNNGTSVYQWYKNSVKVGTNATKYTDSTLANNDTIICKLTTVASCYSLTTVTSNALIMSVANRPFAGILSGNTNILLNTTAQFNSTVTGGTWSVSNPTATVSNTGLVTGITTGRDSLYYIVTNSANCSDTAKAFLAIAPTFSMPTITSFTPLSGVGGTAVTITGTNFTASSSVNFGNIPATTVFFISPTTLYVTAPTGPDINNDGIIDYRDNTSVPLSVTTAAGTVTAAQLFSYGTFNRQTDSLALVDFYNSTNGANWTANNGWLKPNVPISNWKGITTDANGRVTAINLYSNNLVGTIPNSIGNITFLNNLVIYGNKLTGSIPASIGNLSYMTVINMGGNQLTGSIPASMGNLSNLVFLNLYFNQLSDSIPSSLGNLKALTSLYLTNNLLSGKVPTSLTNLSNLTLLALDNNQFTFDGLEQIAQRFNFATYPNQKTLTINSVLLGTATKLSVNAGGAVARNTYQWYKDNQLYVTITGDSTLTTNADGKYLAVVTNSQAYQLALKSNSITVSKVALVQPVITSFTPTSGSVGTTITIYGSGFSGTNAVTIGGVTANLANVVSDSILTVIVPNNAASGYITITTPVNTVTSTNTFTVTTTSRNTDSLALVDLYNSTNGSNWINNAGWLQPNTPISSWNGITVNTSTGRVTAINLYSNNLVGTLPASIGNLTYLQYLIAYSNKISGSLPSSIGNLTNLYNLNIGGNLLNGSIPSSFGNLTNLTFLSLYFNQLTGSIPATMGNMYNLRYLYLSNNQLSGTIPSTLTQLSNLSICVLNNNLFNFDGLEQLVQRFGNLPVYTSQKTLAITKGIQNNSTKLSVGAGGSLYNNTYKWYRNKLLYATVIADSTLTIPITDTGKYYVQVNNTIATALTLYSDTASVSSFTSIYYAGSVINPLGKTIPSVTVSVKGTAQSSTVTNGGNFTLYSAVNAIDTITPYKNNDIKKANGVSTIDISLMQAHILQKTLLNSPYKIIAADVDGNGKVSSIDVTLAKRLILGLDTTFTGKKIWTFIDANYQFPDPTKPFPYPGYKAVNKPQSNQPNQNFIGLKLGDVNYDWNPNILGQQAASNTPIELYYDTVYANNTNEIVLHIKAKNFKSMIGMQFTMAFNHEHFAFDRIINNQLGIEYSSAFANNGQLTFIWNDANNAAKTFDDDSELFSIVLHKKGTLTSDEQVELNGDITTMEAYDANYQFHSIVKGSGAILTAKSNLITAIPEEISVYPNPSNGTFSIALTANKSQTSVLQLLDINGATIRTKTIQLVKGKQTIPMELNIAKGNYFLKVVGMDAIATQKIVIVK